MGTGSIEKCSQATARNAYGISLMGFTYYPPLPLPPVSRTAVCAKCPKSRKAPNSMCGRDFDRRFCGVSSQVGSIAMDRLHERDGIRNGQGKPFLPVAARDPEYVTTHLAYLSHCLLRASSLFCVVFCGSSLRQRSDRRCAMSTHPTSGRH